MNVDKIDIYFNLDGETTKIQCKISEIMENAFKAYCEKAKLDIGKLYFLYGGGLLEPSTKIEDICKNNSKEGITIIVEKYEENDVDDNAKEEEFPKEILCPVCGDCCLININDYKITLNQCNNNHSSENILLDEYFQKAKFDDSKIICDNETCQNKKSEAFNREFFRCLDCKKNLCPLCKTSHDKKHKIINYDLKNYVCSKHNLKFIFYSETINKNLCDSCDYEGNDNNELIKIFELFGEKKKINNLVDLRKAIDDYKKNINDFIELKKDVIDNSQKNNFLKTITNLEEYYKISEIILNNCDPKKNNYQVVSNRIKIFESNKKIINDLEKIIKENDINIKVKNITDIYNKMMNK